jgi:hypothetical protein
MIDTDKYEGHTEGPWDYEYGPTVSEHIDDADILTIKTEATFDEDKAWVNQRLAADAPLLLAEVKRLREQNKLMLDYFWFIRNGGFTDADDLLTKINELIGDE